MKLNDTIALLLTDAERYDGRAEKFMEMASECREKAARLQCPIKPGDRFKMSKLCNNGYTCIEVLYRSPHPLKSLPSVVPVLYNIEAVALRNDGSTGAGKPQIIQPGFDGIPSKIT